MNVFHSWDSTYIFIRWKMKCSIQLGFDSFNRTFNLSPHEIYVSSHIHYLYIGVMDIVSLNSHLQ